MRNAPGGGSVDFLVDGLTRQQLALGFATAVDGRFSLPWLNTAPHRIWWNCSICSGRNMGDVNAGGGFRPLLRLGFVTLKPRHGGDLGVTVKVTSPPLASSGTLHLVS